jgi:hypothetical protein
MKDLRHLRDLRGRAGVSNRRRREPRHQGFAARKKAAGRPGGLLAHLKAVRS